MGINSLYRHYIGADVCWVSGELRQKAMCKMLSYFLAVITIDSLHFWIEHTWDYDVNSDQFIFYPNWLKWDLYLRYTTA